MIKKRQTTRGVRYDVRLRDPQGREYSRTFATKRRAEDFENTERADRLRGAWVDPRLSNITFSEWAAQWLAGDPTKRAKTRATDEGMIRLHMTPTIGDRRLATITPLDVQRLVADWTGRFAPSTVRRMYAVLRAIFSAAVESDMLGRSPCRRVNLPRIEPTDRHQLTSGELHALADTIGADYRPMVYTGAVLGLRWGECAALRVGRLDLLRSTLTVAEGLSEVSGEIIFTPPKSAAGRRSMRIPAPLVAMLSDHLAMRGLTGADANALVFSAPKGGPLRYGNWRRRIWLPAVERVGLEGLGFHDLRRAAATAMVAMGVDLRTAQNRLGHSDPRLTLAIYAQATDEGDRDASDRLGAHFMSDPEADPETLRGMDAG